MLDMPKLHKLASITFSVLIMYLNNAVSADSASTSKQWTTDYHTYKPDIVVVRDQVLHLGLLENAINVTSIDGAVINVCNFTLPANRIVKSNVVRPVVLGNGKIVVRTMMSQDATTYQSPTNSPVWDLFIIIDPFDCSSTAKTFEVYNKGWERDVASVVPYHDSFDVFYRKTLNEKVIGSEVLKTPRRFNDQAEPINLDHYFGLETDISGFHVETVKPRDAAEGYICTHLSKIDKTMSLKRLDSKFQLVKETKIEHSINSMSVTNDSISLCYITVPTQTLGNAVTCRLFDTKDLTHRATVKLHEPNRSDNDKVLKPEVVKVVNLPDGAFVAAIAYKHSGMSKDKGQTTDYYLQRINADGSTNEAVHAGTYTNFFDLMNVVSLGGNEVCLTVVGEIEPRFGFKTARSKVSSKCFNML